VVGATIAAALQFFAASQCLLQEPWPHHAEIANGSSFDFIIVGAGTAGSTLAARLAELKNISVLLIPAFHNVLIGSPYDWNFTTMDDGQSSQGLSGGSQRQPRGKMLGGSGSINNMIYARGFPADYDEWADIAGPDWSWENVLPYFKKTEQMTDQQIVNNEELMKYHGRDGEIEVSGLNNTSEEIERYLEAFREIGFNIVDDMTNPHTIGAGKFSHTIRDGTRDSSLTALLNKSKRDNIFVLKNTVVTKILLEHTTAVGVKVLTAEYELHFYADKEVIVSAGTFNTPKLLMLSGIGPKEHLNNLGIGVVKDLPAVGGNLHDHVMFLNYIAAENSTCNTSEATQHMDMIKYLYDRSGSLANADSMGALLALKGSTSNTPDFAFYPTCTPQRFQFYEGCVSVIGLDSEICAQLDAENQNNALHSIAVVLLKPKSRGKVRLRSTDPLDDPLIYSGTFDNPDDLDDFPEAVDVINSLAETGYFKNSAHVVDIKIDICDGLKESEEVKCKARAMATSAWHAVGTASMGQVVDGELRVFGIQGLRVVDASVMAKVTRGNTNAPVVMIAEKAADLIKERNKQSTSQMTRIVVAGS
ncbi:Ecdysone oxidase, partial [Operophtera brumata]